MKIIKPIQNGECIRIRFTLSGKLYQFSPVPNGKWSSKRDQQTATATATKIQNDIIAGNFDQTLDRYRLTPKPVESSHQAETTTVLNQPQTLLELWDHWVETLKLPAETKAVHYRVIRRQLEKFNPKADEINWLIDAKLHPRTINKRLSHLKSMYAWAVHQKLIDADQVPSFKPLKHERERIEPFSVSELKQILETAETVAPHYLDFLTFLMLTGCRLSEAIGLRWCRVNFEARTVTICESLSIDLAGNGYKRKLKPTKTGSIRVLTMSEPLRALLEPLVSHPDDLVFTSRRGYIISSGYFRESWTKILKAAKVPYRRPHIIRHSFASHAITQGMPLTAVSYMLGHADTTMVSKTYGHLIDRPNLPVLELT